MDTVNMRLDHRWYIGYDLGEPVPDDGSLSKIRERYRLETFQRFFEHVVELCIEAGLVWGEEFYLVATKVRANAAVRSMVDRTEIVIEHVRQLFREDRIATSKDNHESNKTGVDLVAKYNGERITGSRKPFYTRIADKQISLTDPDATHLRQSGGGRTVLGYRDHYVVDDGKARVILSALVTPASVMDNTPMLDMVHWACTKWRLNPKTVTGDTKYGTAPNIAGLERAGMKAFVPIPDLSKRNKYYKPDLFRYSAEENHYICPQGQIFKLYSHRKSEQVIVYKADAQICSSCPVKHECTESKSGRHVFRSIFQEYFDRVRAYHYTEDYQRAMRKRGIWVEPLFGEAKQFHRLRRFRLRRLEKVNIEGLMVAAGQNLKRLLKFGVIEGVDALKLLSSQPQEVLVELMGWTLKLRLVSVVFQQPDMICD